MCERLLHNSTVTNIVVSQVWQPGSCQVKLYGGLSLVRRQPCASNLPPTREGMNAYTNPPEKEFPGCPHSTVLWGHALVAQWRPAQTPEASSHERRHHLDASTPWGPRSFSVQKPQVCDFYGHKQMQMKFQPFYSKQLLTMYKYCILAHMKNTTSKAPRNVFIHVTGPFTKRVYDLL